MGGGSDAVRSSATGERRRIGGLRADVIGARAASQDALRPARRLISVVIRPTHRTRSVSVKKARDRQGSRTSARQGRPARHRSPAGAPATGPAWSAHRPRRPIPNGSTHATLHPPDLPHRDGGRRPGAGRQDRQRPVDRHLRARPRRDAGTEGPGRGQVVGLRPAGAALAVPSFPAEPGTRPARATTGPMPISSFRSRPSAPTSPR